MGLLLHCSENETFDLFVYGKGVYPRRMTALHTADPNNPDAPITTIFTE